MPPPSLMLRTSSRWKRRSKWEEGREMGSPPLRQLCEGPVPLSTLRPEISLQAAQSLSPQEPRLQEVPLLLDKLREGELGGSLLSGSRGQAPVPASTPPFWVILGQTLPLSGASGLHLQGSTSLCLRPGLLQSPTLGLPCRAGCGMIKGKIDERSAGEPRAPDKCEGNYQSTPY